jgi:hypothetical protein
VRQNWYDWRQNPRSLPAVALLAAAKLAGLSLDSLVSDSASLPDAQATRLESLERQVAELTQRLERRERQDLGASATGPARLHADAVIAELSELGAVGRQLGRQWETAVDEEEDSLGLTEVLKRRVGRLEARLLEVSGMVGVPFGGFPSAPASLQDDAMEGWLQLVLSAFHQQLAVVQKRVRELTDSRQDARRAGA